MNDIPIFRVTQILRKNYIYNVKIHKEIIIRNMSKNYEFQNIAQKKNFEERR